MFSIPFTQVCHDAGVGESYIITMGRECGCACHGLQASWVPGAVRFCFMPAAGGKGWAILSFAGSLTSRRFHLSLKGPRVANYFVSGRTPPEMKRDPTAYIRAAPRVSAPNLHSQEMK